MKRLLVVLLAGSLIVVSPALASAAKGGGHGGGQTIVTREKVVIHKITRQPDHRYDRSGRRDDRQTRNYHRSRHAPAHVYYKNHQSYRHQPNKVARHHVPVPEKTVIIGVPSVIIRLGF